MLKEKGIVTRECEIFVHRSQEYAFMHVIDFWLEMVARLCIVEGGVNVA